MKDKFIDTNLLVYLFSEGNKASLVEPLIKDNFSSIMFSSQVLGELYNVLTRKKLKTAPEARHIIEELIRAFEIIPVRSDNVAHAMHICEIYGFSYWDSLIIATALDGGCTTLYSEDLQHTQVIENQLTVINPFN